MKGYGQFCPIAMACETFAERWTPLILRELLAGARRFNEIRQGMPLISRTLLGKRLRELEAAGVVQSQPLAHGRGREYRPTRAAEELREVLERLGEWGQRWATAQFDPDNLDLADTLSPAGAASKFKQADLILTNPPFGPAGGYPTRDDLTITDRVSDIIIRGGSNISAAEIEEALMRLPDVAECAVVAAPDPRLGERAVAFIRLRAGAAPFDLAELQRALGEAGLPKTKWVEGLHLVENFPRTPSGKIRKFVLRDELRRG